MPVLLIWKTGTRSQLLLLLSIGLFCQCRTVLGQYGRFRPPERKYNISRTTCAKYLHGDQGGFLSFLNKTDSETNYILYCEYNEKTFNYNTNEEPIFYDQRKLDKLTLGGRDINLRQIRRMPQQEIPPNLITKSLPEEFDARQQWPKCASIRSIKNQGKCLGCWAVAITSALDDRLCIFSNNSDFSATLSSQDLLNCCTTCGTCGKMCEEGGVAEMGYDYFVTTGIVTGGENKSQGCVPYGLSPNTNRFYDGHRPNGVKPDFTWIAHEETCFHGCRNPDYPVTYKDDKLKGKAWFVVTKFDEYGNISLSETERSTQLEIMINGSVTVTIEMYDDLRNYTSGVYNTSNDDLRGYHVMRCIGWGVDKTTRQPYWLIANSWGPNWGENGYMRIQRGIDVAGVESRVSAGIPAQYERIATPNGNVEGSIVETERSKAMGYVGIDANWRRKLYIFENYCERHHSGEGPNGKDDFSNG